jgi:hypothetical protein
MSIERVGCPHGRRSFIVNLHTCARVGIVCCKDTGSLLYGPCGAGQACAWLRRRLEDALVLVCSTYSRRHGVVIVRCVAVVEVVHRTRGVGGGEVNCRLYAQSDTESAYLCLRCAVERENE